MSEGVFRSWMRIPVRRGGQVLWLLADNVFAQNLIQTAAEEGVATERLIFAPRAQPSSPARFQLADLFPRHLPLNAGTTASDCLLDGHPS